MTSIEIPNSVTSIGDYAFSGCSSLTSIEIPNSVTSIGDYAFSGCSSLTSIEIPNSVTSYGSDIFRECSRLTSITALREEPCELKYSTFNSDLYKSATLYVPNPVKRAYVTAARWRDFWNIEGIEVEGVATPEYTYNYDFVVDGNYYKITDFPNLEVCVTYGETPYAGDVVIPETVEYKGKTLTVTSVAQTTFLDCSEITSLKLPSKVTTIGDCALRNCNKLTKLEIPALVTEIGSCALYRCTSLKELVIDGAAEKLTFADENPFMHTALQDVYVGREINGNFSYMKSLKSVTIGEYVNTIESNLFSGCTNIDSVVIADGETDLEFNSSRPFSYCSLKSLYMGRNLQLAKFSNITSLERITIGNAVDSISEGMFKGCSALMNIYCHNSSPCLLEDAFDSSHYLNTTLHVPAGSVSAYQSADGWKAFWNVEEFSATAIKDFHVGNSGSSAELKAIYTLDGRKVSTTKPHHIYIFKYSDGTIKKIINK